MRKDKGLVCWLSPAVKYDSSPFLILELGYSSSREKKWRHSSSEGFGRFSDFCKKVFEFFQSVTECSHSLLSQSHYLICCPRCTKKNLSLLKINGNIRKMVLRIRTRLWRTKESLPGRFAPWHFATPSQLMKYDNSIRGNLDNLFSLKNNKSACILLTDFFFVFGSYAFFSRLPNLFSQLLAHGCCLPQFLSAFHPSV